MNHSPTYTLHILHILHTLHRLDLTTETFDTLYDCESGNGLTCIALSRTHNLALISDNKGFLNLVDPRAKVKIATV
jgi:hypothetical protein